MLGIDPFELVVLLFRCNILLIIFLLSFNKNEKLSDFDQIIIDFLIIYMSFQAKWNLDLFEVPSIEITQISILPQVRDNSQYSNNLRLLILSHSIAFHGTPAFYLENPPSYSQFQIGVSVVMVFDFNHSFNHFQLDKETFEVRKWTWIAASQFSDELMSNFQRALALRSLYEFKEYNPLYFTTFIIIPGTEMLSEPFIYQKIPLRCGNVIRFRVLIQGSLKILLDYRMPVSSGNYILLPPYEHLFSVVASSQSSMTILYVDRTVRTIDPSQQPFALITRPNVSLSKYFSTDFSTKTETIESICHFPPVDFMNYGTDDIENFFSLRFINENENDDQNTYFDFDEPTGNELLNEQIRDQKERKIINSFIGQEPQFPSHRCRLTLIHASFLSFFRFDFGFSKVNPPINGRKLGTYSIIQYERLGIPNILVNCHGKLADVPADKIIDEWEEKRYLPISGSKSAHFVVFCQDNINKQAVKTFFDQFCHIYLLLGFGDLSPFPRFDAFYYSPSEGIASEIERFFSSQELSQFQEYHILTFIVSNPIYDPSFMPRSIITYVRPWSITSASENEMKTLAFVVYSRIRLFSPSPYGKINLSHHETAIFFFGFRYQPPFILRRNGNQQSITLHIAYEPKNETTAWMDDIGSVLHVLFSTSIKKIRELVHDAVIAYKVSEVNVAITILAEGITKELHQKIQNEFGNEFSNFSLFAVHPTPALQVVFNEQFDDDAVIHENPEQMWEGEYLPPLASCYVVSHNQPPYHISSYTPNSWKSPESIILEYAKSMSHLSWLSVKPGSEKRTISYPPHICALLRKTQMETLVVNQFEFLPSTEKI